MGVRVVDVAAGGRFVRTNDTFQRMVGYTEEELRERTFFDILHPEDVAENRRLFEETVAGSRGSFQVEQRCVRKDGSIVWSRLTAYPLHEPEGAPTHLIGLVEDITERKLVERRQLESARRLESFLESAVDAIVTIGSDGVIQSVNPATERMFGYDAAELLGENVAILMPSPHREEHDRYLRRYLETGEARIIGIGREAEARRKDGTVFPVDLTVSELRLGDERLFMGTLRDLSERKLLEASLLQAQKMEAIGRLAGGVAHDFNTLLGTITGYSEMLRDALPEEASTIRDHVERIHQAARRGAALTRQLLAFSRRQEVRPRLVDPEALTAETGEMIRRLIGEDILFEHTVEAGVGAVAVDPGQLQQVLLNLAVNAADAMPRGGRLSVRWRREEVARELPTEAGPLPPGSYAVLEVEDSGVGMDAATRQRIFEPFFTTKETGKGTGLGLSTVFGIVRQWDAGITVESEPGAGTTFRLHFPAAEAVSVTEPRRPEVEDSAPCRGGSETVLLVEDDELFRGLVQSVLEASGYRVLAAADPESAGELCVAAPDGVDILVSDLVMPGGNGAQLAARLRLHHPGLRVILMSGYSDESLASRELDDATADAFLEKPFSVDRLLREIRRVLERPASVG